MADNKKATEDMTEEELNALLNANEPNEDAFTDSANQPREGLGYEDDDEDDGFSVDDLDDHGGYKEPSGNTAPKLSDTDENDEANFRLLIGLMDNTRAIGFSLMTDRSMDHVDKYTYYKDWDDPKHKQFLEAGRIVSKKYSSAVFNYLPELTILIMFAISSAGIWSEVKSEKAKRQEEQNKKLYGEPRQTPTPVRRLQKID